MTLDEILKVASDYLSEDEGRKYVTLNLSRETVEKLKSYNDLVREVLFEDKYISMGKINPDAILLYLRKKGYIEVAETETSIIMRDVGLDIDVHAPKTRLYLSYPLVISIVITTISNQLQQSSTKTIYEILKIQAGLE